MRCFRCFLPPPKKKADVDLQIRLEWAMSALHEERVRADDTAVGRLLRKYECKICFDAMVETAFLPCGHASACSSCAEKLTQCPICRVEREGTVTITFS